MNKYENHLYVIPENNADRQIATGFVNHHSVDYRRIKIMPPAGGWRSALKTFSDEYFHTLRSNQLAHVVMLIDFDDHVDERRRTIQESIPDDLKPRTFVVGCKDNPETTRKALRVSLDKIGELLAGDCSANVTGNWDHEQFQHNDTERKRLVQTVKPFLF